LLYIARTVLEDRTLRCELAGYEEYTGRVRYRLIPGLDMLTAVREKERRL